MDEWEHVFRTSLTEHTFDQMVKTEKEIGLYARTALSLVGLFFKNNNRFPVNYNSFWKFINQQGYDPYEHLIEGPIVDAAFRYVELADDIANLFGIENMMEDNISGASMDI